MVSVPFLLSLLSFQAVKLATCTSYRPACKHSLRVTSYTLPGIHRHQLGRSNQQLVLQVRKARALGMELYIRLPLHLRSCDSNVSMEDTLHNNARKTKERTSQPIEQGVSPTASECLRTKNVPSLSGCLYTGTVEQPQCTDFVGLWGHWSSGRPRLCVWAIVNLEFVQAMCNSTSQPRSHA